MALDAAVTVAIAFALHRAYNSLENVVDLIVFRQKHDAQTYLYRMSKTLMRAKNEATIDRAVVEAPYERFDLTMAALYRADGQTFVMTVAAGVEQGEARPFTAEHELVRFLATERTRLHVADLRAHVAADFHAQGAAPTVVIHSSKVTRSWLLLRMASIAMEQT